jgi:hypothetical protein
MVLVLRRRDRTTVEWLAQRFDASITSYVRHGRRDGWIRLPQYVVRNGWVRVKFDSGGLDGFVEPLAGQLVRIRAGIRVIESKSGREVALPSGPPDLDPEDGDYYVIERVSRDGWVQFRKEVGADFSCGDEEAEKHVVTPATPRFRVRIDRLFDRQDRPYLTNSYPQGC